MVPHKNSIPRFFFLFMAKSYDSKITCVLRDFEFIFIIIRNDTNIVLHRFRLRFIRPFDLEKQRCQTVFSSLQVCFRE